MKLCLRKATIMPMLMIIAGFAWGQSIFYAEPFNTNQGWTLDSHWSITTAALKLTATPPITNYDLSATSPDILVPAVASDLVVSQFIYEYVGQGTPPETYEIIAVAGGTPTVLWSYSTDDNWGGWGGQDLILSLAAFAGQTIKLKFRAYGEDSSNFRYWHIYDIKAYGSFNQDLAVTSLSGTSTPSVGSESPYVATVCNTGLTPVNSYSVKLMQTGDVELVSVPGTFIAPGEIITYTIPWTPAVSGETQIWAKVVFAGDEFLSNNQTAPLTVSVAEAGILTIEIGTDTTTNPASGAPTPYGTWNKAFRQQLLYRANELSAAGGIPGMISALAFNVQSLGTCSPMPNYTIRLKHTDQIALTPTFELGDYTTVWHSAEYMPITQWNIHYFSEPFLWDGSSNLIVDITSDLISGIYTNNAMVYYSSTSYESSLRFHSDLNHGSTGTTGLTLKKRSNIRFFILTPGAGPIFRIDPGSYDFGTMNLGSSGSRSFTITNIGGGTLELNEISIAGSPDLALSYLPTLPVSLTTGGTAIFTVSYSPFFLGENTATVSIVDNLGSHTVILTGSGTNDITIGDGSQTDRIPVDFAWHSSLFETIYTADEMNGFVGMITGVKFYNRFTGDLTDKPIKIWLGSTAQTDLNDGWIPSTHLTQVFDGTVDFPSGTNVITINFPEPYWYLEGGNLAMMVSRPFDTDSYSSTNYFKTQTIGTNRSRRIMQQFYECNPAAPGDGTVCGQFPKTTFIMTPIGVGNITGTVFDAGGSPLAGVEVNVDLRSYATMTNAQGYFAIPNVLAGAYTVNFSRYGYVTHTMNISIAASETEVMNLILNPMTQVNVTGSILASDTGSGIPGAVIKLRGYEDYSSSSTATGSFTIPSVFTGCSYLYNISAAGYTSTSGIIVVGAADYNMGNITLSEIAYAPSSVEAELNEAPGSVSLSWDAPDTNPGGITEGFESYTFPPTDWSQIITNTGPADPAGVSPTWGSFGTITMPVSGAVAPTEGLRQAGLLASSAHQDEWLLTPYFNCPPDAHLAFDTYCTFGSPSGDHYYVKISRFGVDGWTVLWNASAQEAGVNLYEHPVTIDLTAYAGMEVKLAFHAEDPPSDDGLRHAWFIDNINIGSSVSNVRFSGSGLFAAKTINRSAGRSRNRALSGYKVWRLLAGQEHDEASWTFLTDGTLTNLNYEDQGWTNIPSGTYKWAVKAVYTADIASVPAFSNALAKEVVSGNIVGFVRTGLGQGIADATILVEGGYSTTTNHSGAFSLSVPVGIYSVTATHASFDSITQANIVVKPNQNTTVIFITTLATEDELQPVAVTALRGNYPNPFNRETTISYDIKDAANVRLAVYNVKGQLVRSLVNADQASGRYRVIFNGRDDKGNPLSSGIYLYRFSAGKYSSTRKMMLME